MSDFKWKNTDTELPKENTYVIGISERGTWVDKDDPIHVNTVVVKFVVGLSKEDRQKMKNREIPNPQEEDSKWKRSDIIKSADEDGNNKKPYCWNQFGPDKFFGQDIKWWMEIPSYPPEWCEDDEDKESEDDEYRDFGDCLLCDKKNVVLVSIPGITQMCEECWGNRAFHSIIDRLAKKCHKRAKEEK